jgi:hypothetical protein
MLIDDSEVGSLRTVNACAFDRPALNVVSVTPVLETPLGDRRLAHLGFALHYVLDEAK